MAAQLSLISRGLFTPCLRRGPGGGTTIVSADVLAKLPQPLLAHAECLGVNANDREDLVQDTLVKMLCSKAEPRYPVAYAQRVLRNLRATRNGKPKHATLLTYDHEGVVTL